jgi:DNA integrity scanning protein DisA with diadenylate cyclase activity
VSEPKPSALQAELLRSALTLVGKKGFDHLLFIGDLAIGDYLAQRSRTVKKKLVQAVTTEGQCAALLAEGLKAVTIPAYDLTRQEKLKLALVAALAASIFKDGDVVLALVGRRPTAWPDSILLVTVGATGRKDDLERIGEGGNTWFGMLQDEHINNQVLGAVLDLALSIAVEGWEGHPIGTLFVVGDTAVVMEKSRQLTLNPFQGYSEAEKNLMNPDMRDALRNFAVLDGAFVIREDGVVLAAGRYLIFDEAQPLKVPLGLGARHMAAAGLTRETEAFAVVVSQTTGTVRVFRQGETVLELSPSSRRVGRVPPSRSS